MTRCKIELSEKTDLALREYLNRVQGGEDNLSEFVDQAVRREVLRRTVKEIQKQNDGLSESEAMKLADQAVKWARAHRS